ncbi:hypothetical protein ES703_112503 [subsurface metagenome]
MDSTVAVPDVVVDCNFTIASPDIASFIVVPSKLPGPVTENVIVFVATVTSSSSKSHILAVINDVDKPSAVIPVGSAVFMSFAGTPVVVTFTVPSLKLVAVDPTVAVPVVIVDCNFTVAFPDTAAFVVVSNNVPSPVTENVIVFVAVVTELSPPSHILVVINDVDEPSAVMLVGLTVLTSFSGKPDVVTTLITPLANSDEVDFTVAIPDVVVDCKVTVASPDIATLVVVSNNVPSPVTENVIVFVAVVTGLSPPSHIVAVINDVDVPSATMFVGDAVFTIFGDGEEGNVMMSFAANVGLEE